MGSQKKDFETLKRVEMGEWGELKKDSEMVKKERENGSEKGSNKIIWRRW